MIKILYKKKVWELVCPKELKFENGCIRNIMIKRNSLALITNIKEIKKIDKIKALDQFI